MIKMTFRTPVINKAKLIYIAAYSTKNQLKDKV